MEIIISIILSCLSSMAISFFYEGKLLIKIGEENYKIKLGHLSEYDEELKTNFFPPMNENNKKIGWYLNYIIFIIPVVNISYSIYNGKRKEKKRFDILKSKNIITNMTKEEILQYNNTNNKILKMNFTLFDSMDSYKENEPKNIQENNAHFEYKKFENEDSNYSQKQDYEKDMSYLIDTLFNFSDSDIKEQGPVLKKIRK